MAELGHDVVGIDVDPAKIAALSEGRAPFHEPGFPELLASAPTHGGLRFTTDMSQAAGASVHFLCVGTPQRQGSAAADLTYVDAATTALIPHLAPGDLVVGKSTVPVGTAERLAEQIEAAGATLLWNPEFLREGFAVNDTLHPDRLVYGVASGDESDPAVAKLDEVYRTILAEGRPRLVVNLATAQLVKVAANAFLATKISFINAMAELCDVTGGDVTQLADAIGHDVRIGRRFLNAGLGFGGGCLPKDIRAFKARADELDMAESLSFLDDVDAINRRRRGLAVRRALELLGGSAQGRRVAVLGAAFKPNSDDIRDSPALEVAALLQEQGADVVVTDPAAIENARAKHPELTYMANTEDALAGAEVVLLLTEWTEFVDLDPVKTAEHVASPRIVDGRNVLDPTGWRAAGWQYVGLGRP